MAFRYPATGLYTFDTQAGTDADAFLYSGPLDTNAVLLYDLNTDRRWCHEVDATTSQNVGPSSGAGGNPDGYIYIETSSPTAFNDVFHLEKEAVANDGTSITYDASNQDITVSFKTNQRGNDNDTLCELQTNENGAGWVTRATFGGPSDPDKVLTSGAQIWSARVVDLTGLISDASTRIRWQLTLPASGTTWHNDYALDEILIEGVDQGAPPPDDSLFAALMGAAF